MQLSVLQPGTQRARILGGAKESKRMGRDRGGTQHYILPCINGQTRKRNAMQCIVTAHPSIPPPFFSLGTTKTDRQAGNTVPHSRFIIFAPSRFHPASLAALAHATSRAGAAKQVLRMRRIKKAKPCQCHAGAATLAVSRGTLQDLLTRAPFGLLIIPGTRQESNHHIMRNCVHTCFPRDDDLCRLGM